MGRKDRLHICDSARNVVIYHGHGDHALSAGKIVNRKHRITSHRLGMSGLRNSKKCPTNIWQVDCDEFNNIFDGSLGHTYFLDDDSGNPSPIIKHISHAINKGRVDPSDKDIILEYPPSS